jgi:thiol-disulfide isomerase/thioredoxin
MRPLDCFRRRPASGAFSAARAFLFGLVLAAGAAAGLAMARPLAAQDIALGSLGGERLAESDLGRGAHVVVIWASWSPRSRDIVVRVNALASRWKGKAAVITVDFQEDRPTVEAFLAGKGLEVPAYLDPEGALAKKYAIATLPGLLVLKDGAVAYHGKLPENPDQVIGSALH